MSIKLTEQRITVRELFDDYANNGDGGVTAFGGQLDVRPKYQREYVYKDKQRDEVIDTVRKGLPLNVLYWADNGDQTIPQYEVMDGQQRIISICDYVDGEFAVVIDGVEKYFHSLDQVSQDAILDYELLVYFCDGNHDERMEWFERINIAGEELTQQEIWNAVFVGPFVMDAKRHFSKNSCVAYEKGGRYLNDNGDHARNRQGFLRTALSWIVRFQSDVKTIKEYMSKHQHDRNAKELWEHFVKVINWVEDTFKEYRPAMKGLPWGDLYAMFHNQHLDPDALEKEISALLEDDEVSDKGIWQYVLTRKEKYLNLRQFNDRDKKYQYKKQGGHCAYAGKGCPEPVGTVFALNQVEADHIVAWRDGGKTEPENCQILCKYCNNHKGAR